MNTPTDEQYIALVFWTSEPDQLSELDQVQRAAAINMGKAKYAAFLAAAPKTPATGCTRSHPHENMSAACEAATEVARAANRAACLKASA